MPVLWPGLYLFDFKNMASPTAIMAGAWPDGRPKTTHYDIKWMAGQPVLMAVGDYPYVSLYQATA